MESAQDVIQQQARESIAVNLKMVEKQAELAQNVLWRRRRTCASVPLPGISQNSGSTHSGLACDI